MADLPQGVKDRLVACTEMMARTGANEVQIRYSDDEEPVVWFVVAKYPSGQWDAGAAGDPLSAAVRLLEAVMDGGNCTHCKRPTGFAMEPDTMPMDDLVCWYQYDPSTKSIVKGCVQ